MTNPHGLFEAHVGIWADFAIAVCLDNVSETVRHEASCCIDSVSGCLWV